MVKLEENGMSGFRDMHGFNTALLGKHIWNFCQKPNSLIARMFKARYFSRQHVLHANKGTGSSFIWKGILEAKETLKQGFRWVLGDGKDIRMFKDPWLKGKADFYVEDHHLNINREEKVCHYFRSESKCWEVQKVRQDFLDIDSQLILQIRIPRMDVRDRVAWVGSSNGFYNVKSAYQYWMSHCTTEIATADVKGWDRLWKLQLPHKLRVFLWRFCNNNVPVRILLKHKGVSTPILCPMCGVDRTFTSSFL